MKRAIKSATKAEAAYQDAARALGCVICRWRIEHGFQKESDGQCGSTHIHHRNGGDHHGQKQVGQHAIVSLGAWHHDGVPILFWSDDEMRDVYGPSFKYARDFRTWTQDVLPDVPGRGTEAWQAIQDQYLQGKAA
jgi:hypothetical protein